MKPEVEGIRLPELPQLEWINGDPGSIKDHKDRCLLVDFWDYTCVQCLRSLPHLIAWHKQFEGQGLLVLGIHTPEFPFGREMKHVQQAVAELGIPYPVALDPEYEAWNLFQNRFWPSRYLFNRQQHLHYYRFGEGDFSACESAILDVIGSPGEAQAVPVGADTHVTSEVFFGLERGRIANGAEVHPDRLHDFRFPARRDSASPYLAGPWRVGLQYIESGPDETSAIWIRYTGGIVDLVVESASGEPTTLEISRDGEALAEEICGPDLHRSSAGASIVSAAGPRLYGLIRDHEDGTHDLRMRAESGGIRIYALSITQAPGSP